MDRVGLYTLGCKVSQYETEAIAEAFEREGFCVVPFEKRADVYVINTCTVTAESDRKSRQIVRRARKTNPDAVVMVTGCYSQVAPDELLAIPGVAYVSGSDGKMKIPQEAIRLLSARRRGEEITPVSACTPLEGVPFERMTVRRAPRTRAYVKIEDGCECKCAYCAIPGARGNVRSKAPLDVLAEVNALADGGTREVVLTGIEIASYGRDLPDTSLIDLLELLDEKSTVCRLRLGSLTPEVMKEDFVLRLSSLKRIVPHFHLSMQSGSDAVLRGMRRRYNTEMAMKALSRLRAAIPRVRFTTDMMTGFPGEGEAEFAETCAFVRRASFLDMHVFAYSRRKNTPAAAFPDQVNEEEKRRRSAILIDLAAHTRDENLAAVIADGTPLSVLFETEEDGYFVGHSAEYIEVRVPSEGAPLHGEIRSVHPLRHENGVLYGTLA